MLVDAGRRLPILGNYVSLLAPTAWQIFIPFHSIPLAARQRRDNDMSSVNQEPTSPVANRRPGALGRIKNHIQGKTLNGLMELVPLLVTIIVVALVIDYTDTALRAIIGTFTLGEPGWTRWVFPGLGLLLAILLFYLVGLLLSVPAGRTLMRWKNTAMNSVPVLKTVYGVTEQATATLTTQYRFSRVVFLEWPREGMVALGFVTGRAYSAEMDQSLVVVYIPTVPNPTSGNMAFVNEDHVLETGMTVEDAMKLVFSGGIVLPSAISLARMPDDAGRDSLVGYYETRAE